MNQINLINRMSEISIKLSNEKNVDKLIQIILESCIDITSSDAGSIYIVDENQLIFKYTVNHSVSFPSKEFKMDINRNSIAGNCVINKKLYNLKDMEDTMTLLNIKHDKSFDESVGYKTLNMLVIPMENFIGDVIGVMQLINKKSNDDIIITNTYNDEVLSYTKLDETLTSSLASQASILLERTRLQSDLRDLLDSMIITLSTALEQRDPITAGHSKRVTKYALLLANEINQNKDIFQDVFFGEDNLKELQIASLLHDVGKIGVPEKILQKKNRLTDEKLNEVILRLYLYKKYCDRNGVPFDFDLTKDKITKINSVNFLCEDSLNFLVDLKERKPFTLFEHQIAILSDFEFDNLSVRKGNLTNEERKYINDHAKFTNEILTSIKWGKSLKNVPDLASKHHEKLDGTGYPNKYSSKNLSILDRILPIVDIYDALTAKDRPYKPALSVEKSCDVLLSEVKSGSLDKELVHLFIQKINSMEVQK